MNKIKCKECDKEFDELDALRKHRAFVHKIKSEETYIEYKLDGIIPTCICGCGSKTKYMGFNVGYRRFKYGHVPRVINNWGHNAKALKKAHDTQREMYKNGELHGWLHGLTKEDERVKKLLEKTFSNPNRGKNISKALTGKLKSEEHKAKLKIIAKKRWSNQDERDNQSQKRVDWMARNNYTVDSKTEKIFLNYLLKLGLVEDVDFIRQYYVREIKSFFDFYFFKSSILIEIDGDFWHCNPNSKFSVPTYECQFRNLRKDKIKNIWVNNNADKYSLYRFWEYDIDNNIDQVISKLKQILTI